MLLLSPRLRNTRTVGAAIRGNRLFSGLLAAGVLLRLIAMLGYPPAIWFNDSYDYVRIANAPFPHPLRSEGYGLFLWLLKPFHSLALVTTLQHALIVGIAVLGYRVLVRDFDVRRRWAAVAVAPPLLDGYQIELEHLLLSDTLFTALVFGAVLLMARPGATGRTAGWRRAGLVGLLLGVAAVTRTVGVPLIAVLGLYLLVRRTRWPVLTALAAAFALPLGAYAAWFHAENGRFALTGADGIYIWGRTSAFADCSKAPPPPRLARLCPYDTPDHRPAASHQIWEEGSPTGWQNGRAFDPETNELAQEFALWAIRTQPLDYARVVSYDFLVRTFSWGRGNYPTRGTAAKYRFPKRSEPHPEFAVIGGGDTRSVARAYEHGSGQTKVVRPFSDVIRVYQKIVNVRGTMLGVVLLVGAAGMLKRRARPGSALLWMTGVALLAVPPLTADFDYRYMLPALPFACVAAVIAWGRRDPEVEPALVPAEPESFEEAQPARV